jgi:hypothetical protein
MDLRPSTQQEAEMSKVKLKIVVVGDCNVGKTSFLISTVSNDGIPDDYIQEIIEVEPPYTPFRPSFLPFSLPPFLLSYRASASTTNRYEYFAWRGTSKHKVSM